MLYLVWLPIGVISIPICLSILFGIASSIYRKLNASFALLDKIPSPTGYPVLGNVLDLICASETLFATLRRWAKEYHPAYVLWSSNAYPVLVLWTPEDMQTVLGNTKHNEKSKMYAIFDEWLGEGLLTSNGDKWQQRRKILTPTFHFNILKRFIPIFNKHSRSLANNFENDNATEANIIPHVHKASLHTIAEAAMGVTLSDSESEKKYRQAINRKGELSLYRITRPWYYPPTLNKFSKHYFEERILTGLLKGFTQNVINEREANFNAGNITAYEEETLSDDSFLLGKKKQRFAMLDLLLNAKRQGNIDNKGICEEVDTFMFEGHDTISTALSFLFMLVANHPKIQEKLIEEIQRVLDGNDRDPNYDDLHKMTYMDMVIKESLRLYPSVPLISRLNGEEFITCSGFKVPKGTSLMLNIFDTHRLESVYPNPNLFDPERFTTEKCKTRHPYAYLAFSAGSRNCIGQKYAVLNMKCKITAVLRKFILLPVDTPETITLVADIILRTADGIKIKYKPRK